MAKHKSDKPLYDKKGRWVEERGRIKGAIRKSFRLSPQMKETLDAARVELPPALKKDGTPGKKNRVRYKCAMCGELFPQTYKKSRAIQVDHIEPVVPLWKKEEDMSYDEIVRGVFCNKDNLQVLCSLPIAKNDGKVSCHRKKTNEENFIRRKWADELGDEDWELDYMYPEIPKHLNRLKKEYQKILEEKEAKKNARRKRKNTKRKGNSSKD